MTTKIKDLNNELRPRERLKKYGASSLANDELLAILLRTGTKDENAKELSTKILNHLTTINDLENTTLEELSSIKGVGEVKAITIMAAIELGKRVLRKDNSTIKLDNARIVYDLLKYDFINCYQEKFLSLFLDSKNNLISIDTMFIGTLSTSTIHPREVFKLAVKYSAYSIILVHNHPSGNSDASKEDIEMTSKMIDIGKLFGIPIRDHIIIGNNNYYSIINNKKVNIYE